MNSDQEKDLAMIDQTLAQLSEHFDSVHIFVTRHEQGSHGGTVALNKGIGNVPAQMGQIQNFILSEDERSRWEVRKILDTQQ